MITKLLSAAVKLYLRSQVSRVEDLQVRITGKNRQILKGFIPQVFLYCQKGIYQGLHLREVEVKGNDIAIKLPEVYKKKPLKLLEPIVVEVKLSLNGDDLYNSLDSRLLQSGLTDLWQIILETENENSIDSNIKWNNIAIGDRELCFSGTYQDASGKENKLDLSTGVSLSNSHTLCFSPLKINSDLDLAKDSRQKRKKIEIDLGRDVEIEKLIIESERLLCWGKITVKN